MCSIITNMLPKLVPNYKNIFIKYIDGDLRKLQFICDLYKKGHGSFFKKIFVLSVHEFSFFDFIFNRFRFGILMIYFPASSVL